jgi:hypothetical protein
MFIETNCLFYSISCFCGYFSVISDMTPGSLDYGCFSEQVCQSLDFGNAQSNRHMSWT